MAVPGADVLGASGGGAEDHFAPGGAGARDGAAQGGGGEQSARCETASCVCRVWLVMVGDENSGFFVWGVVFRRGSNL